MSCKLCSTAWSFLFGKYTRLTINTGQYRTQSCCTSVFSDPFSVVSAVLTHLLHNHNNPTFFTETGKHSKEILFANNLQMQSALTLFSKPIPSHPCWFSFLWPSYCYRSSGPFPPLCFLTPLLSSLPSSDFRKQPCSPVMRIGRWPNGSLPSLTPMNSASKCLFCWFVCLL